MSAPARYLKGKGFIKGLVLDYGCGRGKDAEELGADAYDPTFAPDPPTGMYDTILCTYVLNVVSEETEAQILGKIETLLKPGGAAYVTVRRDLPEGGSDSQRYVLLNLPVLKETATHCIYLLEG